MSKFISLGPKANGFFDQTTGLTIARGEKIEVNDRQLRSRRIAMALNQGHLIFVQPDQKIDKEKEVDIQKLEKKLKAQYEKGVTLDKMIKDITMDQAKALADAHEIEIAEGDTVKDIIEAVVEDFKEEEK
jgi:predicted RNA-binding protein with TRAM domain